MISVISATVRLLEMNRLQDSLDGIVALLRYFPGCLVVIV